MGIIIKCQVNFHFFSALTKRAEGLWRVLSQSVRCLYRADTFPDFRVCAIQKRLLRESGKKYSILYAEQKKTEL